MKNFLKQLISEMGQVSSKRFISLWCLVIFTGVVIASLCGVQVPDIITYSLVGLIVGNSALTFINKKNPDS